jgi:tRNA(Ile)-lysidine synthase
MRRWRGVLAPFRPDDRVAIAVSGGADSVALAWILHELGAPKPGSPYVRVVGLVHVNHGLRGADADADEAFCRDLAARLSWPIHVTAVDVRSHARTRRQSLEAAARALRYSCFDSAIADLGATVVATAHTMDDQAETVLLRLLRGASSRGLSGVRQRRGHIVRPLLAYRRSELREFLVSRGEPFREDASNADLSIPRNRLRHDVVPVLERFTPAAVPALARVASLAADDEAALNDMAAQAAPAICVTPDTIDARALTALPAAIARRVVRLIAERTAPAAPWSAGHIEAVRKLAAGVLPTERLHLDAPGTNIDRLGNVITVRAAPPDRNPKVGFDRLLTVPGSTDIPEAGVIIEARTGPGSATWPPVSNGRVAVLDGTSIAWPLRVRSRRPGDRLKPVGAPGHRKLQDLLVDRKIPRDARDRVPIVVDADGRILWVAGVTVAEVCRATAPGASMVILELTTR